MNPIADYAREQWSNRFDEFMDTCHLHDSTGKHLPEILRYQLVRIPLDQL